MSGYFCVRASACHWVTVAPEATDIKRPLNKYANFSAFSYANDVLTTKSWNYSQVPIF